MNTKSLILVILSLVLLIGISNTEIISIKTSINNTKNKVNKIQKTQWPQLVGKQVIYAKNVIKKQNPTLKIVVSPQGTPFPNKIFKDRVRIFVDKKDIVTQIPIVG